MNTLTINNDSTMNNDSTKKKNVLTKNLDISNKRINITRISKINFQSLIKEKVKNLVCELIKIDSMDDYNFYNFDESFENVNCDKKKVLRNLQNSRIKLDPVMISDPSNNKNLEFYWGEWDLSGNMEGFGIKISSNGNFYFGTFKNNKMHGIGIYVFADKREKNLIFSNRHSKKMDFKKNIYQSKHDADNDIDKIRNKSSEKSVNKNKMDFFCENFEGKEREYYVYIGEFEKNNFEGNGQIYFKNTESFTGSFESNRLTYNGNYRFKNL